MKFIDKENWPRKMHFDFFRTMDHPHFNICANVDITNLFAQTKKHKLSLFKTVLYLATKTGNEIRQFRQRIRVDQAIEHESVQARFTIPVSEDVFGFCLVEYHPGFKEFYSHTIEEMEKSTANPVIENIKGRDDLIYMSCIPWVSFTSFSNPIHLNPIDSIPRIVWGKIFEENSQVKMPLSVQAHHALVDGVHIGRYFNFFEELAG
jgi:chloramphenicol O-acetyltransferase type A